MTRFCAMRAGQACIQLFVCYLLLIAGIEQNPGPALKSVHIQPALLSIDTTYIRISKTPGDGHCFLHALSSSISTYVGIRVPELAFISYIVIILLILKHFNDSITNNRVCYVSLIIEHVKYY